MSTQESSADTAQTDGEPAEPSDKPEPKLNQKDFAQVNGKDPKQMMDTTAHPSSNSSIPLPPKDARTYDKQPGYTVSSLKKLVESGTGEAITTAQHSKQPSSTTLNDEDDSGDSSVVSPTVSESDWGGSLPSTRAASQPASRAASFSSGKAGNKLEMSGQQTVNALALPPPVNKSHSSPASPVIQPTTFGGAFEPFTGISLRAKAPSVKSHDGKFHLKDLIPGGQKLSRKSSQRSTGSSRKSDTDRDSVVWGEGGKGGPKSTAGDSTVSLSKKYGVCGKLAIGKGATSVVRLAHKWDRSEEKLYAVKEFRKRRKNESEKEYVKKLTAEFCISSTLHHVNIVETVDLVQDESHNWCEVMEFCPGGDLYAAIKKGGMSPSEVECCFKQILRGVEYLHSQGVAHRDIKPENLFFDAKGQLKIGDYGASTVYRLPWESTIHMSTGLCGSEPYIAPEQFLGKPYDARLVDIWACGVVYYCLHFQELPWRAAQQADSMYSAYASACASSQAAVSSCPPTINNLNPRACRTLIRKMLEPNPKARSPIEEVMQHPWVQSIEVCHLVEKPQHIHVHARALSQQQLKDF